MKVKVSALLVILLAAYLAFWPVPVAPVAWEAPDNPGYVAAFSINSALTAAEALPLGAYSGPEAVALDSRGWLYVSTHEGWVLRSKDAGQSFENWVNTEGRPLGLAVDAADQLVVADAYQGLLRIGAEGQIEVLATAFDEVPLGYVNDVAIAESGAIYFTDSSEKFPAKRYGGTYPASLLDIMEHGGHGRLFRLDPVSGQLTEVAHGFNFANGVATLATGQEGYDQVVVVETGNYRVLRFDLADGVVMSQHTLIDNLPGFPDNIARAPDGNLWLGLVSPRSALLDKLADKPGLRKLVQRLPSFIRPKAQHYGMVVKLSPEGEVLRQLQDPSGTYYTTTGAAESATHLFVSRLHGPALLRINK